jgi:AraC-like DNA-binding protein
MSVSVGADQKQPRNDRERTLRQAAEQLGCHPETLRRQIKAGRLRARRGAHGAYLVQASDLIEVWIQPIAERKPRLDEEGSWVALAKLIYQYDKTRAPALALLDEARADSSARPRLRRLIEVQRLRLTGMTYRRIAEALGISERQARRLSGRDLEVALRIELTRDAGRAQATARRRAGNVVATMEDQLRGFGFEGRTRAEILAAWPRRLGKLQRRLTKGERVRLRSVGLNDEQIEAIDVAGIPVDALNHLLSHGLTTMTQRVREATKKV